MVELTSSGVLVGVYDPTELGGYRGVYELPNGNILTTNGSGVHEIDRTGDLIETRISGVSARYIQFVQPNQIEPIPTLSEWGMIMFFLLLAGSALWFICRRMKVA